MQLGRLENGFTSCGALAAMLVLGGTSPASAQEGGLPADEEAVAVLVTASRLNLATTQGIKRDSIEIVDAIAAEDISRLPDFSVSEALQRVTGVQIARDRGEGGTVAIRGLTQMATTLNGREVFTAGNGRNLDFNDIAADQVAGIDVYKTSAVPRRHTGARRQWPGVAGLRPAQP